MSRDDPVLRGEYEQFKTDVERRLQGHDGLYGDLRETREELVKFTETLRAAREQVISVVTDRAKCQDDCKGYRAGFEKRIRALERFRWQIAGALIVLSFVVPAAFKWG